MALWTPANTSTYLWADASDSGTITQSGGAVSLVQDKSGNNRNPEQTTVSHRPGLITSGLNSKDVFGFNSSSQHFELLNLSLNADCSLFFVVKFKNTTTDNRLLNRSAGATNTSGAVALGVSGADIISRWTGATWSTIKNASPAITNQWIILSLAQNGTTTLECRVNGSFNKSTSSYGFGLTGNCNLGGLFVNSFGGYLDAEIAQFIAISDVPNEGVIQKIEGYLAGQYALQANLPANHPFKNVPPQTYTNLWDANSISAALWLDPSDAATITQNNNTVSQLDDKSGNSRHFAQTTASNQPDIVAIRGVQAINLAGKSLTDSNWGLPAGEWSLTLVVNNLSASNVLRYYFDVSSGRLIFAQSTNTSPYGLAVYDGAFQSGSSPITGEHIICFVAGDNGGIWVDGSKVHTITTWTDVPINGNIGLGSHHASSINSADAYLGQFLLESGKVSDAEREIREGWAAHQYTLQGNLPSDHPYRDVPPLLASSGALLQIMLSSNHFNGGMS